MKNKLMNCIRVNRFKIINFCKINAIIGGVFLILTLIGEIEFLK